MKIVDQGRIEEVDAGRPKDVAVVYDPYFKIKFKNEHQ